MSYITFLKPYYLYLLLIIPVLYYFYIKSNKNKKDAAIRFSNIGLIKQATKKRFNLREHLNFYLFMIVLSLMIIGFADPNIPLKQTKEGVNVVLALDVSGSMQATDYTPTRVEASKKSAEVLIKSLKANDQIGIVLFESGATTSAYLSPFKDRVLEKLRGIQVKQGQTAIGDGLALAIDMASSIPNKKKVVILLSDGVSNAGVISPDEAIAYAKLNNIQVNTIGMGSNGKVVLGYDWFGNAQYAELDEATLQKIAKNTGGEYYKSVDDNTLEEIYKRISENIKREKEPTSIKDYIFLLAFIIILVQIYLNYGRYRIIS
ncbi:MAG: VWA domain-containing protein [Candidatus Pacearchaeota archaeon]|jgi:Ca-activated chloride channel family protein